MSDRDPSGDRQHSWPHVFGDGPTERDRKDGECELCQSVAPTRERYGIRVCAGCEETFLP